VGAILRKSVIHWRFGAAAGGIDALKICQNRREQLHAADLRRVAAGSIEPVVLREADFDTQ
jgi:hypothetical protein